MFWKKYSRVEDIVFEYNCLVIFSIVRHYNLPIQVLSHICLPQSDDVSARPDLPEEQDGPLQFLHQPEGAGVPGDGGGC